jgi:hypothetical protein
MERLILELLERLEAIGEQHEELFDSEVRESMDKAVGAGFLRPETGYVLPDTFGMYSREGDQQVREALAWFLAAAAKSAVAEGLNTFQKRLAAFQNHEVQTAQKNDFNDFFGWANPDHFDEAGQVVRK